MPPDADIVLFCTVTWFMLGHCQTFKGARTQLKFKSTIKSISISLRVC